MTRKMRLSLLVILMMLLSMMAASFAVSNGEPSYSEDWDGRGTDSMRCDYAGQPGRPATGWIHWVFNTKGASTSAELVLGGTGSGIYEPGEPLTANVWHFYTPYFELNGLTATIHLYGGGLVISDYCPGYYEKLEVSKTVVTTFDREHFWDIKKKVETEFGHKLEGYSKIWLYTDGRGDEKATWTVDVLYDGFKDSGWKVSGEVTIKNTGKLDAVITKVEDLLGVTATPVDFGVTFPYTLPVGETLKGTYSETGYFEGHNVVTVTTERDQYSDTKAIIWGDPAKEMNKTVHIKDLSDLFGEVALGTVTAPNGGTFTYSKDFAFADYMGKCGHFEYHNTAKIVETGQTASATLWVNVQCFKYESAWAKGDAFTPFTGTFSNWGWSNLIKPGETQTMDLWAGAAKSDTSKGTLVGKVKVVYEGDWVTVEFMADPGYGIKETQVYIGKSMFPQLPNSGKGKKAPAFTVAPGQYARLSDVGPYTGDLYVIAHAVVGMPDPSFGPAE